jgi:hypothetical protein
MHSGQVFFILNINRTSSSPIRQASVPEACHLSRGRGAVSVRNGQGYNSLRGQLLPPHEEIVEACKAFVSSYFQLGRQFTVFHADSVCRLMFIYLRLPSRNPVPGETQRRHRINQYLSSARNTQHISKVYTESDRAVWESSCRCRCVLDAGPNHGDRRDGPAQSGAGPSIPAACRNRVGQW